MKVQQSLRWMVVDDNAAVLSIMKEVLSIVSTAEVVCFSSPLAAVEAFSENPTGFDLIISDFDMPELDGVEMCHVLREINPAVKTILATGNMVVIEEEAFAGSFNGLLQKPFSVSALQAVLENVQAQVHSTDSLLQAA